MRYIKDGVFYQNPLEVVVTETIHTEEGDIEQSHLEHIFNPTEEQLLAEGYEEYIAPIQEPVEPSYEEKVVSLIREQYSVNDELAILRQRDTKPEEFAEYNSFCEQCKAEARGENLL